MKGFRTPIFVLFLSLLLAACSAQAQPAAVVHTQAGTSGNAHIVQVAVQGQPSSGSTIPVSQVVAITALQAASPLASPPPTATPVISSNQSTITGPDQFPTGVNPLTGRPAKDPALLSLPPALISVSNFPASARPQAGLSSAAYVFEMYIGEGMTRFLALYYGDFPGPPSTSTSTTTTQKGISTDDGAIGPIRSGRLPYQSLEKLYSGFLVMASASGEVRSQLPATTNIYGSDSGDINSALIPVSKLAAIAQASSKGKTQNLTGNTFGTAPPAGGQDASRLWVFYNYYNQVLWSYDPASQAYLRSQDKADGTGKFYPSTDRLTGQQLAFDNVIVLVAKHNVLNSAGTLIDLDLLFTRNKAYLFRDGKLYPIYWSTVSGDYEKKSGLLRPLRFVDQAGNPFPLKPGRTWVEIVDLSATLGQKEPGYWQARFYAP
jgi:Protein of unknown function (DUF3048) C-terminal domain/Protein of unknown function (DUF3048) N-terminal domain